jgi:pyridoxine 5-phosphate synthase
VPSVVEATRVCVAAGAPGITVHPRADARHITFDDVREIAARAGAAEGPRRAQHRGDPRPDLLDWPTKSGPTSSRSCRCAPAKSRARRVGSARDAAEMREFGAPVVGGIRVSIFVDPDRAAVGWAAARRRPHRALHGAVRARVHDGAGARASSSMPHGHARARTRLGVNAGHDLDLET